MTLESGRIEANPPLFSQAGYVAELDIVEKGCTWI